MIHQIYSSLQSFKELHFNPKFNIILADRSPDSTELQTRNRAGKSSVAEIIHFLMGGDCGTSCLFKNDALIDNHFGITFDLSSLPTSVERTAQISSKVLVVKSNEETWPIKPITTKSLERPHLSNMKWRAVLGKLMFGLYLDANDRPLKEEPTFRSLLPYFVRRQSNGGFLTPEKQSSDQQLFDLQLGLSYLLGLDWKISYEWQQLRAKEKTIKELRRAAKSGSLGNTLSTSDDLYTEIIVGEKRLSELKHNLSSFRILPEYRELEERANDITLKMRDLRNQNVVDRTLMEDVQRSLHKEVAPSFDDLERLYEEVGVALPNVTVKRFEEVKAFHAAVIKNRHDYLAAEFEATRERVEKRNAQLATLDSERSELLKKLDSGGALDQYSDLQAELSKLEARVELLRERRTIAEQIEGSKSELELNRNRLSQRLRLSFKEQDEVRKRAIIAFAEISSRLYETPGQLTITASSNGPQFEVKIQGRKSKGITNMQTFCFDMMLMKICNERGIGPGFLFHDSHLFDGVDERQIRSALRVGAELAEELNFQYIVTMNSDDLPDKAEEFDPEPFVLQPLLSDLEESGGLFGIRFD